MCKYKTLLILLFSLPAILCAQDNIVFHHLTTEDGLSYDEICSLLQDDKWFLWIGTANGLCRYDGSHFLVFKNDPKDSTSISDNSIRGIFTDKKNKIWAGTYGGLNMLDGTVNKFTRFKNYDNSPPLLSSNYIPYASQLDSTHFLIAHAELEILNTANNSTEKITLPKNTWSNDSTFKTAEIFECYKVFIDHRKKWWLIGEAGLVKYDPATKKFNLFCLQKNIPGNFRFASTWDCTEDAKGNIWIASAGGLFEYNDSTDKFGEHYPLKFLGKDVKSNWVKCVLCDNDGSVWFGTDNGLFHFFPRQENISCTGMILIILY